MYQPKFNSVLVQIDDTDAAWGGGNDESMMGKSFHKGRVVEIGKELFPGGSAGELNPQGMIDISPLIRDLVGKDIIWNEGDEAGTTFEEDGKLYGFIYWYSIRGVKDVEQTS